MEAANTKIEKDDNEGEGKRENKEIRRAQEDFWSYTPSSASLKSYPGSCLEMKMQGRRPRRQEYTRKKNPVQRGRVTKRSGKLYTRMAKKGAPVRRKQKPVRRRPRKIYSVSTSVATLSMSSVHETCSCSHCRGHRRRTEVIQAGSTAKVLSPLFVKTNEGKLRSQTDIEMPLFSEVTPGMIFDCLRNLTMWRQSVPEIDILNYTKKNYPVNPNNEQLMQELSAKLKVAAVVGFIVQDFTKSIEHWSLSTALDKRKLAKNHVTMFWKLYADTLALSQRNTPTRAEETNLASIYFEIV